MARPLAKTLLNRQVAALPWRLEKDGSVSVLLITSRTNAKWMLPKGWPMPGKTDAQAALQEAREEAGVDGSISDLAIGSYRYMMVATDGSRRASQAIVFALRVEREDDDWKEARVRTRRWFTIGKAAKRVYEADLRRLLSNLAIRTTIIIRT